MPCIHCRVRLLARQEAIRPLTISPGLCYIDVDGILSSALIVFLPHQERNLGAWRPSRPHVSCLSGHIFFSAGAGNSTSPKPEAERGLVVVVIVGKLSSTEPSLG